MSVTGRFAGAICALAFSAVPAGADDLFASGNWSAMASDRQAERVGDSLTVLIFENSVASNSAQTATKKGRRVRGEVATDAQSEFGEFALNGAYDGAGQNGRSGKMVAQISVVVDSVLPNGDLHVFGEQVLNVNGERTLIRLQGRVRRADISSGNTVLSTRLADVAIDYDGTGFITRSAKPGVLDHVFNWLGVL